ncbi:hypothetical protein ACFHPP_23970, partial [Falsiroseomonas sp. E2-1-a20]
MTTTTGNTAYDLSSAIPYPWKEGANDQIQFVAQQGFVLRPERIICDDCTVRDEELARLHDQALGYVRLNRAFRRSERLGKPVGGTGRAQINAPVRVEVSDQDAQIAVTILLDTLQWRPDKPRPQPAGPIAWFAVRHTKRGRHQRGDHIHVVYLRTRTDGQTLSLHDDALTRAVASVRISHALGWPATVYSRPVAVEAKIRERYPEAMPALETAMRDRIRRGKQRGLIEATFDEDTAYSIELAREIQTKYPPSAAARRAEQLAELGRSLDGKNPDAVQTILAEAGWELAIGDKKTKRGETIVTLFPLVTENPDGSRRDAVALYDVREAALLDNGHEPEHAEIMAWITARTQGLLLPTAADRRRRADPDASNRAAARQKREARDAVARSARERERGLRAIARGRVVSASISPKAALAQLDAAAQRSESARVDRIRAAHEQRIARSVVLSLRATANTLPADTARVQVRPRAQADMRILAPPTTRDVERRISIDDPTWADTAVRTVLTLDPSMQERISTRGPNRGAWTANRALDALVDAGLDPQRLAGLDQALLARLQARFDSNGRPAHDRILAERAQVEAPPPEAAPAAVTTPDVATPADPPSDVHTDPTSITTPSVSPPIEQPAAQPGEPVAAPPPAPAAAPPAPPVIIAPVLAPVEAPSSIIPRFNRTHLTELEATLRAKPPAAWPGGAPVACAEICLTDLQLIGGRATLADPTAEDGRRLIREAATVAAAALTRDVAKTKLLAVAVESVNNTPLRGVGADAELVTAYLTARDFSVDVEAVCRAAGAAIKSTQPGAERQRAVVEAIASAGITKGDGTKPGPVTGTGPVSPANQPAPAAAQPQPATTTTAAAPPSAPTPAAALPAQGTTQPPAVPVAAHADPSSTHNASANQPAPAAAQPQPATTTTTAAPPSAPTPAAALPVQGTTQSPAAPPSAKPEPRPLQRPKSKTVPRNPPLSATPASVPPAQATTQTPAAPVAAPAAPPSTTNPPASQKATATAQPPSPTTTAVVAKPVPAPEVAAGSAIPDRPAEAAASPAPTNDPAGGTNTGSTNSNTPAAPTQATVEAPASTDKAATSPIPEQTSAQPAGSASSTLDRGVAPGVAANTTAPQSWGNWTKRPTGGFAKPAHSPAPRPRTPASPAPQIAPGAPTSPRLPPHWMVDGIPAETATAMRTMPQASVLTARDFDAETERRAAIIRATNANSAAVAAATAADYARVPTENRLMAEAIWTLNATAAR